MSPTPLGAPRDDLQGPHRAPPITPSRRRSAIRSYEGAGFLHCSVRPCVLRPRHRSSRPLLSSSSAPCLSSVGAGRPPAVGLVQCTRCTPGVWGLPSGACSPSPCNGVFLPGHVIPHGTARVAVVPSDTSSYPLTSRVLFQPLEHGSLFVTPLSPAPPFPFPVLTDWYLRSSSVALSSLGFVAPLPLPSLPTTAPPSRPLLLEGPYISSSPFAASA